MTIGGLHKLSLSDYPGHCAAIVFAQGCNYRCPFCHNGGLIPLQGEVRMDEAEIFAFLSQRAGLLDAIVVSGGEPTLQPDLAQFLERGRELGLKTAIETNGSRPGVLAELLRQGLLDFLAMDIKAPPHKYPLLSGVPASIDEALRSAALVAESGVAHQFRTTWVRALLSAEDIETIRGILPAGSDYRVQEFRARDALDPSLRETD